jgi:4'-phosphopantetheinyl transferase EntD
VDRIDGLFDDDVTVLSAPVDLRHEHALGPEERAVIEKAREKRRQEFATARVLAKEGLGAYGVTGFQLLNDESRAPIWPDGIAGSVSHCDTRAFVALTERRRRTVGIDGEHRTALERRLWKMTMLPDEITTLERLPEAEAGRRALVMFSAKEALYKAQHPRTREYMEFAALHVEALDDGTLRCTFQRDVGPIAKGYVAPGRWTRLASGETVTGVWIPE